MRLGHSKKNSLDYENLQKSIKTDRPSIRAFLMTTEGNEVTPSLEPTTRNTCYTLANHFPTKQRPKTRSPYLKTSEPVKSHRKGNVYVKTEESGPNDPNDGLILKISQLKIEMKNFKEREKRYLTKINELESDKEMLINALQKFKKKMNETVKENKHDKRKLSQLIDSFRIPSEDLNLNKVENQTLNDININNIMEKELKEMDCNLYKTRFSKLLDYLYSKTQEIETHTNSVVGENVKIRKEIEGYRKMNENLKNSSEYSKIQLQYREAILNELIKENNLLNVECQYLRNYIKDHICFDRDTAKDNKNSNLSSNLCPRCNQPIPSYIKALSLSLNCVLRYL